jgi:hypothetical protein
VCVVSTSQLGRKRFLPGATSIACVVVFPS